MSDKVTVEVNLPFWKLYFASLQLIRYSPYQILSAAIFPLAGCFLAYLWVITNHKPQGGEWFLVPLAFLFTPLSTALAIFMSRRKNKLCNGSFTYTFDTDGMRCDGQEFNLSVRWGAILRVIETSSFTYFFIAPARAHCIPRDALVKNRTSN